jgi:hypothetical protein
MFELAIVVDARERDDDDRAGAATAARDGLDVDHGRRQHVHDGGRRLGDGADARTHVGVGPGRPVGGGLRTGEAGRDLTRR